MPSLDHVNIQTVKLGETVSLTYVTRMEGPATVNIYSYMRKQKFGALPVTFDKISVIFCNLLSTVNTL